MVKYTVQQDLQPRLMQCIANRFKVFVRPKSAVYLMIVSGVIPMGIAFKQRIKQDSGGPCFLNMFHPVQNPQDSVRLYPVILPGRAAQPQGINLINNRFFKPHIDTLTFY